MKPSIKICVKGLQKPFITLCLCISYFLIPFFSTAQSPVVIENELITVTGGVLDDDPNRYSAKQLLGTGVNHIDDNIDCFDAHARIRSSASNNPITFTFSQPQTIARIKVFNGWGYMDSQPARWYFEFYDSNNNYLGKTDTYKIGGYITSTNGGNGGCDLNNGVATSTDKLHRVANQHSILDGKNTENVSKIKWIITHYSSTRVYSNSDSRTSPPAHSYPFDNYRVTNSAEVREIAFFTTYQAYLLPIKMSDLQVESQVDGLRLYWNTSSEAKSDFFRIERSKDGFQFESLAQISAAGNSTELIQYEWIDKEPFTGYNFYRVVAVDQLGYAEVTEVKRVFNMKNKKEQIRVFPNPGRTHFSIEWIVKESSEKPTTVEVYNMHGARVIQQPWSTNLPVDMRSLEGGLYLVNIVDREHKSIQRIRWMKID